MKKNVFVSLIGIPNVGKSSLMNSLIGEKISIVTKKAHTTRNRIMGIITIDDLQYVFIDTPGIYKPKSKLGKYMVRESRSSQKDVDVILFITDISKQYTDMEYEILERLNEKKTPFFIIGNKDDIGKDVGKKVDLKVSALKNTGTEELFVKLKDFANEGEHFFPDDQLTDMPEKFLVSEIVREKILNNLRDEIPHGVAVTVEKMHDRIEPPILDIGTIIYTERESHKGIIIGKGGSMLKKIMTEARLDIETFFDYKINLKTHVIVKENWRDDIIQMKNFGFEKDK